jgi:hypothetical protein
VGLATNISEGLSPILVQLDNTLTFYAIATTTSAAFLAGATVAGVGFGLASLGTFPRARVTRARAWWHEFPRCWGWPGELVAWTEQQATGCSRYQGGERSRLEERGRLETDVRGRYASDQSWNAERKVGHDEDGSHQSGALSGRG